MLLTVDCTEVSVDGIIPDQDACNKLTHAQLEVMEVPVCRRVSELVTRELGTCDLAPMEAAMRILRWWKWGGGAREYRAWQRVH